MAILFIHCDLRSIRSALFVGAQLAPSFGGVFDPRQRSLLLPTCIVGPPSTEDTMRIFERLRGRSRSDSAIERKLFEPYRRSLAETRGRNLDPGLHREQSQLLFLLLGRRKAPQ
jgi:hypothetical protein